mgnify:CR=1 FL=1
MAEQDPYEFADYLGDGVYVRAVDQRGAVVLTTETHEEMLAPNRIVIEPEVLEALLRFRARMHERHGAEPVRKEPLP